MTVPWVIELLTVYICGIGNGIMCTIIQHSNTPETHQGAELAKHMLLLNAIFAINKTVLFLSDSIDNSHAIVKCYFCY